MTIQDSAAIHVRGARVHNLKDLDVDIPHGRLVVVTGVSGSGKSSLVFDTVYTEAQRQLIETFSAFARQRLPKLTRPDVEMCTNLTTSILIDQKPLGRNLRSTVGTATDCHTFLRLLFARCGSEQGIPSFHLGFNNPAGACGNCAGLGQVVAVDLDQLLDYSRSLRDGAILHSDWKVGGWNWRELLTLRLFDVEAPLNTWVPEDLHRLLYSDGIEVDRTHGAGAYTKTWRGIATRLETAAARADDNSPSWTSKYIRTTVCPECHGLRLNERARMIEVAGLTFAEALTMEIADLAQWLVSLPQKLDPSHVPVAHPVITKLERMLNHIVTIGAGYLHLNRAVSTLSGGEAQRIKTARQLDCDLTGLTYVLDEPSSGLHPMDVSNLVTMLKELRDNGNSILVVEHDPDVIVHADHIIEIGPGPGVAGGEVVYTGGTEDYRLSTSLLAQALFARRQGLNPHPRPWTDSWQIDRARVHNLQDVSVKVPKGVLTVLTGVAGSGKSTLVHEVLRPLVPNTTVIDQAPIGRTSRSTPISYVGGFDRLRALFSDANGVEPSLFSFNSTGACAECKGAGVIRVEMSFLDEIDTPCDFCQGQRFNTEVLQYTLQGLTIADALDLSVDEALESLGSDKALRRKLKLLHSVGLGYLSLGQPQSSLSGGETQRLKIARHLGTKGELYILDEPTTGLSVLDVSIILGVLQRLVESGNSVVVIEHNLDIIAAADWIIDMGPGGGRHGGRVIAEGTPAQVCKADTPTGRALSEHS